ncbi:MAG: 30S ribosomal protein S1 [Buchnera aphidicola (Periphyllus lyropictus)]|uniref:30S ribosomal protein S1 n=1 Tax=Buchnera aphidicola TaxID=9 RepID=UPI001ED14DA4|nr:30S ribosomal protein S1 [Buchnera aphidicola]NIH16825.1 30S ribosomal protein S1 [Buchnera aphidicola (Periphyllus lyropictus)]USS94507.1 30S ribosomal protein S1 [Buchnera aphidicola (Periphyllus lyropictus)]
MKESFSKLFKKSLEITNTKPGSIIKGIIISINKENVLVDSGLKSESLIPIEQFKNIDGNIDINIGDKIKVALDAVEDGFGETILSREKAKRHQSWLVLEKNHKNSTNIKGTINGKVKGGFTVELNDIRAFLPGSLVDIRPIRETSHLEGKILEFKVIKLDKKRNNVVVSRRAVIESENSVEREQLLMSIKEGLKIKGTVKNLTDYGAFIDLGGVDGLLHITDMAWKRVKHPKEIVSIGEKILVKILKFDKEKTRVSLGLKQLGEDPWKNISKRYPEKSKITGKITNLTDYGCFVEIEEGIEGLVHISEMNWTNKNIHPSKVVKLNEIVKVMVLDIDEERRRISLGLKQCTINPWKNFSKLNKKGSKVVGKIKSITDFGIFIGLKEGIDGLVHLSDIDWEKSGEDVVKNYKKGDEITTVVLQVDSYRERISLSIKHLKKDPFNKYIKKNKKNSIVKGKLNSFKSKDRAIIKLKKNIFGVIVFSNLKNIDINKQIKTLKQNKILDFNILNIDRKKRIIYLSFLKNMFNTEQKINDSINKLKKLKNNKNFSNTMTDAFIDAKNIE